MATPKVLLLAQQTATSSELIEAVRRRAAQGPAEFTLVVPNPAHGLHRVVDPEDQTAGEGQAVLDRALPALSDAAGAPVSGIIGDANPLDAVQDAVNLNGFDEIIVSTLPTKLSRWLKLDLPHKLEGLHLPVTTVTVSEKEPSEVG